MAILLAVPFTYVYADATDATVGGIMQIIIDRIIMPFITVLITFATLVFIWGVIEYIAKSDSDEGRSTGRRHMMWGIIGLVIMIGAATIFYVIKNFWDSIG
ncbi:MAG: hypothetical protein AAB482_03480 [Patescibacteria group bacterium]